MRAVMDADHATTERLGRSRRERDGRSCGTPTSGASRSAPSASKPTPWPARATCPPDGPDQWTSGTLFPMSSKKSGPGGERDERLPAARGVGEPVGLRRVSGIDAPGPARVRRRDRAGRRELPRPDRVLRGQPVPRRCLRRVQPSSERATGDPRRRRCPRLGDRRLARRRRRVRRRGGQAAPGPTSGCARSKPGSARQRVPNEPGCGASWPP